MTLQHVLTPDSLLWMFIGILPLTQMGTGSGSLLSFQPLLHIFFLNKWIICIVNHCLTYISWLIIKNYFLLEIMEYKYRIDVLSFKNSLGHLYSCITFYFSSLLDRVSAACPFNKAGQHPSQHLIGLRKAVYRSVRANFRASRLATLYMLKKYPFGKNLQCKYILMLPFYIIT